eukprot:TRINITY_DN2991_c0_g1_i2.p1 TRINITY_DN2991_c0_g1~~TRINITY_DN2991_c0_g1_i2.p1  ORF type:complete len:446 (-),score=228.17 TRINITY_DN2991_c0_g1_i2:96-1433(-)
MADKEKCLFPMLRAADIAPIINQEFQIPFTEEDIVRPHASTVRMLLENVVSMFLGIAVHEPPQPHFAALDQLPFGRELHDEAITEITFVRASMKIMRAVGIHDFTLADISSPEPKRLRKMLSAIINFARFYFDRKDRWSEIKHNMDVLANDKQEIELQLQEQRTQLLQLKHQEEAQRQPVQKLQAQIAALDAEIMQLNQEQAKLAVEIRTVKKGSADLADSISGAKFQLVNTRHDAARLRNLIVPSPEGAKRHLDELRTTLEHDKAAVADAQRRAHDMHRRDDTVARAEREVHKSLKLLGECDAELERRREARRDMKQRQQLHAQRQRALQDLNSVADLAHRQHKAVQDKTARLAQQHDAKMLTARQAQDELRQTHQDAEHKAAANLNVLDQNASVYQGIQQKISDLKTQHELEMKSLAGTFGQLEATVDKYHRNLLTAMEVSDS